MRGQDESFLFLFLRKEEWASAWDTMITSCHRDRHKPIFEKDHEVKVRQKSSDEDNEEDKDEEEDEDKEEDEDEDGEEDKVEEEDDQEEDEEAVDDNDNLSNIEDEEDDDDLIPMHETRKKHRRYMTLLLLNGVSSHSRAPA